MTTIEQGDELARALYTAWCETDHIAGRFSYLSWEEVNEVGKLRWRHIATRVRSQHNGATQGDKVLREALEEVERVLEQGQPAICCTVWVSDGSPETLLDHVRAALMGNKA